MLGLGISSPVASTQEAGALIGGRSSFSNTKSLSFDGVNDFMQFSSDPTTTFQSLLGASSFTISYWVKAPDIVKTGSNNTVTFANGVGTSGGFTLFGLGVIYGPGHSSASLRDVIEFKFQGPSGTFFSTQADHSSATLSDDTWIHIAYTSTIDGTSRDGKVYINGSVLTNNSDSNSVDGGDFSSASLPAFAIPATFFNGALTTFAEVSLDEISFYTAAKSASDIADIYNSGVPKDESDRTRLVGYWRLEDNGTDSSSNSNDFAVTGATFSTSVPT